jgi:hypothetical protein
MTLRDVSFDVSPLEDPMSGLERSLIEEFLAQHNFETDANSELTELEKAEVLIRARTYASGRLAEVEARAHYLHEIHGVRRR